MKKILFLSLLLLTLPLFNLNAGGCEVDPIYERNNTGQPVMGLFLRNRPCMEGTEILKTLPKGQTINIIAETDGWYKVKDNSGAIGWSGAALINQTSQSTINNRLSKEHFTLGVNKGYDVAERQKIMSRTRGYILLQVESKGEAWYVDPVTERREYMKDGEAAYNIMRNYGLGISNANLNKLKTGDSDLLNRLSGRIVLQVEENGEAFYINPKDNSIHYLKNGVEAYRIMRELGLGITDSDLSAIPE